MPNFKNSRMAEDIKREMTAILRELKDPRVNSCFLSIVRVEVTNDLSYCKVYLSALDQGVEKDIRRGLKSAAG